MIEPEYVDEERLQLIQNYDYPDDSIYEDTQETSFYDADDEIPTRRSAQREQKLDIEIKALGRGFNVEIPPEERGRFRMSSGYLQVEKSPDKYDLESCYKKSPPTPR